MIETPLRHRKGNRVTHWRRVSGRRRRQQAYAAPKRLSTRRLARRALPPKAPARHRDPIVQNEIAHISHRSDQRRRPAAVLLYIAFGISVLLTALLGLIPKSGNQMTAAMHDTYVLFTNILTVVNVTLVALSFIAQIILTSQALLLGSDTVAREKQADTWDLLLLTGRNAGQIVISKWRAVQLYLFQRYGLLIALRAELLLWLALTSPRGRGILTDQPDVASMLVAPLIVLGATMLDLVLATTVGMTASTLIRRGLAYPAALGLFFVCLFPFVAVYVLMASLSYTLYTGAFYATHVPLMLIAWPIDGAEMFGLSLLRAVDVHEWVVVVGFIAANLIVFAAIIGALLGIARRLADRPILSKSSTR